jgi:hypothetical protein
MEQRTAKLRQTSGLSHKMTDRLNRNDAVEIGGGSASTCVGQASRLSPFENSLHHLVRAYKLRSLQNSFERSA